MVQFRTGGLAGLAAAAALMLGACADTGPRSLVREAETCADFTISLYFENDSAAITPEAGAIIRSAATRARRCAVSGVDVLGLADAPGDPAANQALSERRVQAVTRALAQRGLSQVRFAVGAAGEAGAETRNGLNRPLRRRVDIALHLGPQARAAPPEARTGSRL